MKKLIIAGRTNFGEKGFYIKFKAEKDSMKVIKKIIEDLGSEYFYDIDVNPRNFSNYEKWKDEWIPINDSKKVSADIICGDKMIHIFVHNCPNFKFINTIFDKYCKWASCEKIKP